jgi:hypothetical protein
VLPYFKRSETWRAAKTSIAAAPVLGTQWAKARSALQAWIDAGKSGIPHADATAQRRGFGNGQYTIRDGRRSSTQRLPQAGAQAPTW